MAFLPSLPPNIAKTTGTSNVWASMSVDADHNLLFIPVSSPSPNFYGGNPKEALPLTYAATAGGVEWGGGAVDPTSDTYFVNSSNVVQIYQLLKREDYDAKTKNGTPAGYVPMNGISYGY